MIMSNMFRPNEGIRGQGSQRVYCHRLRRLEYLFIANFAKFVGLDKVSINTLE